MIKNFFPDILVNFYDKFQLYFKNYQMYLTYHKINRPSILTGFLAIRLNQPFWISYSVVNCTYYFYKKMLLKIFLLNLIHSCSSWLWNPAIKLLNCCFIVFRISKECQKLNCKIKVHRPLNLLSKIQDTEEFYTLQCILL